MTSNHLHLLGYLIIFLPLFFCFFSLLVDFPKTYFFILSANNIAVIILAIIIALLLPDFKTHIVSDVTKEVISLGINYNISILGLFFIILVTFTHLLTLIFYQKILRENLNEDSEKLFYTLNLLNLFAIIGLFTTNNIVNLYLFIEIYSFTFYAISAATKENSLNKLAFKYFYQGSSGGILILISLFYLFVNFGSHDFDIILAAISNQNQDDQIIIIGLIFIIFVLGIILKFFPFWLYFDNLKSSHFLSHFFLSRLLFIKTYIGFYLILKTIFFLFGTNLLFTHLKLDLVILAFAFLLIFYGNIKILKNNNLKIIISSYCLIYLGFLLIAVALNDHYSLIAAFAFILHYAAVGLFLLLFCGYMVYNFRNCNIKNLSFLKSKNVLMNYFFKVLILLICAFPMTPLFIANFYLAYPVLQSSYLILVLIPLATTFLVFAHLAIKMISYFYFDSSGLNTISGSNNLQDNIYYLTSFFVIILLIILFASSPNFTLEILKNLSLYLR